MTKADYEQYRKFLLALRARLQGEVSNLADAALNPNGGGKGGGSSAMPIHMADLGSDNFEQEFTLSLIESEDEVIQQIDAALERLDEGTFGICEECGSKIPKARLNAIPYAATCVNCASKMENRQE